MNVCCWFYSQNENSIVWMRMWIFVPKWMCVVDFILKMNTIVPKITMDARHSRYNIKLFWYKWDVSADFICPSWQKKATHSIELNKIPLNSDVPFLCIRARSVITTFENSSSFLWHIYKLRSKLGMFCWYMCINCQLLHLLFIFRNYIFLLSIVNMIQFWYICWLNRRCLLHLNMFPRPLLSMSI